MCRCCPSRNRGEGKYTWELRDLSGSVLWQKVTTPAGATFNPDGAPNRSYAHGYGSYFVQGAKDYSMGVLLSSGHAIFNEMAPAETPARLLTSRLVTDGTVVTELDFETDVILGRCGANRVAVRHQLSASYSGATHYTYRLYDGDLALVFESADTPHKNGFASPYIDRLVIHFNSATPELTSHVKIYDGTGAEVSAVDYSDTQATFVNAITRDGAALIAPAPVALIDAATGASTGVRHNGPFVYWTTSGGFYPGDGVTDSVFRGNYVPFPIGYTKTWEKVFTPGTRPYSLVVGPSDVWYGIFADKIQRWVQDTMAWELTVAHDYRATAISDGGLGKLMRVITPDADTLVMASAINAGLGGIGRHHMLCIQSGVVTYENIFSSYDYIDLNGATRGMADATANEILFHGVMANHDGSKRIY